MLGDYPFTVADRDMGNASDPGTMNHTVVFSPPCTSAFVREIGCFVRELVQQAFGWLGSLEHKLGQWKPCPTLCHPLPFPSSFLLVLILMEAAWVALALADFLHATPTELVPTPDPSSVTRSVGLWAAVIVCYLVCWIGLEVLF